MALSAGGFKENIKYFETRNKITSAGNMELLRLLNRLLSFSVCFLFSSKGAAFLSHPHLPLLQVAH